MNKVIELSLIENKDKKKKVVDYMDNEMLLSKYKKKIMNDLDDVISLKFFKYKNPEEVKKRRLQEIVDLQQKHSLIRTKEFLNKKVEVLIDKQSKKSDNYWAGRTEHNKVVVFPKENYKIGDFVNVLTEQCTSATLIGKAIEYSKNN